MRQRIAAGFSVLVLIIVTAACSSSGSDSAKPITYGSATISPAVVTVGSSLTFTPAKVIPLHCGSADVYRAVEGMPLLLQLNLDGSWSRFGGSGPQPTYLGCLPAPSDKPISFHTRPDFPIGTFVFCANGDPSPEGCATFRTVKA
jgi:hypothetical protein